MEPDFQDQLRIEIEQDAVHIQPNLNFRPPIQLLTQYNSASRVLAALNYKKLSLTPIENKLEVANLEADPIFLHNP